MCIRDSSGMAHLPRGTPNNVQKLTLRQQGIGGVPVHQVSLAGTLAPRQTVPATHRALVGLMRQATQNR
eukprot:14375755-Alexandrium_andersonii.AAC.1